MSLYSALTQVLAPFAAKIKGIQTGYDGTEYNSPGEAVRGQINDLHVLIGDEPGTAISASAISYGDSDVGTELTDVNGRLDEQEEIVNTLNEGGLDIKDDVIEAQITDWLTDHPEATTTVQDGAITSAKFANALKKNLVYVFDTVADMRASTNLIVGMVVKTSGYYTADDGFGMTYKVVSSGYEHTRYEVLQNNLYAVAMFGLTDDNGKLTGDVGKLVETALTYHKSGKTWVYALDGDGVSHPTAIDADYVADTYYIDCSTLFRLISSGITYENSKYNGGNNVPAQGGYTFPNFHPSDFARIRAAYQQAESFCMAGLAYLPNSDYSNIHIGDVVFFAHTDYPNEPRRFMNIDHVAIFLGECGLDPNGKKRYQFIGNSGGKGTNVDTFFYIGNETYLNNIVLCAGFPKQPHESKTPVNLICDGNEQITAVDSENNNFLLKTTLKAYTAYTLKIKVSNPVPYRFWMSVPNHSIYADDWNTRVLYSNKSEMLCHFITGDMTNAISNNSLFRLSVASSDASVAPIIENVTLTEGYVQNLPVETDGRYKATLSLEAASGTLQVVDGNLYADLTFSPAQTGNHVLGAFDPNVQGTARTRYYPCVLSDNSIAILRVSGGNVSLLTNASQYTSCKSMF